MRAVGFTLWYSKTVVDGSSFLDWLNAPDDDVQWVLLYFDEDDGQGRHCRQTIGGHDYYQMLPEMKIVTTDSAKPSGVGVKSGKWTSEENIERIIAEAESTHMRVKRPKVVEKKHDGGAAPKKDKR